MHFHLLRDLYRTHTHPLTLRVLACVCGCACLSLLQPSLSELTSHQLKGDAQSRSLVLTTLDAIHYLFVALGDGHLVSLVVQTAVEAGGLSCTLQSPKKVGGVRVCVGFSSLRGVGCDVLAHARAHGKVVPFGGGGGSGRPSSGAGVCLVGYRHPILCIVVVTGP